MWVTGDVHLHPHDPVRAEFFLAFLSAARAQCQRLVILGDLFDYWIGPAHARRCAYAPVVAALEEATAAGFPVDFVCGNRDFLGPGELRSLGLAVHGDAVVYARGERQAVVTHGDLLVQGDRSYKRYRRVVRSAWFRFGYWLVPSFVRLAVARLLRGASERKLAKVEPLAFPVDVERSTAWQEQLGAEELLMGHLHREETHPVGARTTRMLPGWTDDEGPHFVLGPASRLERFRA
ncbi:MAG: UDP-2,3-diacylglucosamine diphosphatase [Planctomycetota bacterium]